MQRARVSNHPCHRLSVPAAKRFWCRHCMMVFEDAITRWRHSRSCRSGGFDNFIRRREIETQALQKMAETLDPDMAFGPVSLPSGEAVAGCSKELCCFICRQRFMSLDEMREHVKYPCNKPANLQRPSMTVYIEEPTFGTGIQQHFTDGPVSQSSTTTSGHHDTGATLGTSPHPIAVYMSDAEQVHTQGEAKPTNIYVNEKGETVIEVENLDLNTKSGELSLAHLLTQLSQQGIVFDQQTPSGSDSSLTQSEPAVIQGTLQEIDLSQPTAVDAANTLTQLAGSAFRAAGHPQTDEIYTYTPPVKRIKAESIEVQYPAEQVDQAVETGMHKDDVEVSEGHNYIICTDESEVISVVRADSLEHDHSQHGSAAESRVYQGGSVAPCTVVEVASSSQAIHAEQFDVADHDLVEQKTFSVQEPASQAIVSQAGEAEGGVQGSQAEEYSVATESDMKIPMVGNHLQQLDPTGLQISAVPVDVDQDRIVPFGEDQGQSSSHHEDECKASSNLAETSATATEFDDLSGRGNTHLEGCTDSQPESDLLLPQIVSVSSTGPEMSVASMQQSHCTD